MSKERKKERRICFYFIMVIWHQTYGKGQLRQQEFKPTAITSWATLSN